MDAWQLMFFFKKLMTFYNEHHKENEEGANESNNQYLIFEGTRPKPILKGVAKATRSENS